MFQDLSDVVIRGLSLGLSQSDLQGRKSSHSHMEEELPKVAQFIQVHVTQADQAKSQEGFGIPPACVVHKQVTLSGKKKEIRLPHGK